VDASSPKNTARFDITSYQTVYSRADGNMPNDGPLTPDDYAYLLEDFKYLDDRHSVKNYKSIVGDSLSNRRIDFKRGLHDGEPVINSEQDLHGCSKILWHPDWAMAGLQTVELANYFDVLNI
jgi:hypothetical protein